MSLDLNRITARVDEDYDRYQIVLIDDFDALVGEVQRLRRERQELLELRDELTAQGRLQRAALRKIDAADISCQTCIDIKAIARDALGESGGGDA